MEPLAAQELAAPLAEVDPDELRAALEGLGEADAVGHRIVHGGSRFREPVVVDDGVRRALGELVDLAPLHQPKSLAALDAVSRALPGVPAVACFDTAFHATLPAAAATYALPADWTARWGVRRYGFHGLSHALDRTTGADRARYARAGPADRELPPRRRRVAVRDRRRAIGRHDDGLHAARGPRDGHALGERRPRAAALAAEHGEILSESELGDALEHQSGLLGLSGTADMREVVTRAGAGDASARLALEVYLHRLRAGIASMTAAMGGLDVLAFTGGVGEHSAAIREAAAAGLAFLGVAVDPERNEAVDGEGDISSARPAARTVVISAREDLEIAGQVRSVLETYR